MVVCVTCRHVQLHVVCMLLLFCWFLTNFLVSTMIKSLYCVDQLILLSYNRISRVVVFAQYNTLTNFG